MNRVDGNTLDAELRAALSAPFIWQKGTPIYVEIYRRIRQLIVDGIFKHGERLPSESELSGLLNVGRTSLRNAIILLFEDGYVKTFHGKGTFVVYDPNAHSDAEHSKAGLYSGYLVVEQRLALEGEVTVEYEKHRENSFDEFIDERLQLGGEKVNCYERLLSLNGAHAALAYIYYPARADASGELPSGEAAKKWIAEFYNGSVEYVTSSITAIPASGVRNTDSAVKITGQNFLLVASTWYSKDNTALAFCKDYYCSDAIRYKTHLPASMKTENWKGY